MSLFDKQQDLENESDQKLIQLGQEPDPKYPSYLVVTEVERRMDMRKRHQAEVQKHQAANPPDIATQRMNELGGIAGLDPSMSEGAPPQGMPDPGMEQMGGPPPGMEQMGGPPPDMGGPPPMMAYGGLIPGYQNGGAYPDPDQDLYSQNLPGADDYEREGLFGPAGAAAARRREVSERRARFLRPLSLVPLEERTPEYEREREEFLREMGMGVVGSTSTLGAKLGAPVKAVGSRMPGVARRSAAQAVETARAGVVAAKGAKDIRAAKVVLREAERAAADFASGLGRLRPSWLRPGSRTVQGLERQVEQANTVAREAAEAAAALPSGTGSKVAADLAKATADEAAAAAKALADAVGPAATPGRLRTAAGGIASLASPLTTRPKTTASLIAAGLGTSYAMGGDEPGGDPWFDKDERSGLQALTERLGGGVKDAAALGLSGFDYVSPFDTWGGDWARGRRGDDDGDDDEDVGSDKYDAWKANRDVLSASSDDVTADELAAVGAGRTSAQDIASKRRAEIEAARLAANFLSQEERDLSQLRRDEVSRETDLLARELGLGTDRVAELRREMRTEKETDHTRKARLLSGLGAALMGSPRGLSSALQGTTTGLQELDEALRVERRRDLGDVYEQRAKGIDIERSGSRNIASLKASDLEMLAARARAGDSDAQAALTSLTGQEMQAASAYDQMALQIRRASNDRDLANMPSYADFEDMAKDEQRAVFLRTDLSDDDKKAIIAGIDGAISAFRNQNMDLAVRRMDSALGRR